MKRIAALIIVLLSGAMVAAPVISQSKFTVTIEQTGGKIRSQYPTQADYDAAVGSLRWNTPVNISVTNGATGSQDARALLLDDSGTATITCTCTPSLPTAGFSCGSDGISWSTTTTYAGSCKYTATRSGISAISDAFTVNSAAVAGGDTKAPNVPTGLAATSGITGQVPLSWDAASDPYNGSGVDYYEVKAGASVVATVDAAAGPNTQYTGTNVGTISSPGAPSFSQDGVDWTITAAGTGFVDGTSDQFAWAAASVAGAAKAVFKIAATTSETANARSGYCVGASADANAARICLTRQPAFSGNAQCRGRTQTGANKQTFGSQTAFAVGGYGRLSYDGSGTVTCELSTDGNTWVTIGTATAGLGSAPFWGAACSSTSAGTNVGCHVEQVNLTGTTALSYTHNNTTGAATAYSVRACDVAGNCSAYGSTVSATPLLPADTTPPARTVQPSATTVSANSITWSLGTCTDAGGLRGYIPYTKPSAGGSRTTQAEQATSTYTQTGLSASTTYYLDVKCVDTAGNLEATYSTEVSGTTSADAADYSAPTPVACSGISTSVIRCTHGSLTGADHFITGFWTGSSWVILTDKDHTGTTIDFDGWAASSTGCYRFAKANAAESIIGTWTQTGTPSGGDCGTTSSASATIRYNPGHYVADNQFCNSGTSGNNAIATCKQAHFTRMSDLNTAPYASIQGVQYQFRWSLLESGTTPGDYSAGFALVDEYLAQLNARAPGKKMMLILHDRAFGSVGGDDSVYVPAYLNGPTYGADVTVSGVFSRNGAVIRPVGSQYAALIVASWESVTMQRMIALSQAYGARYDNNAQIEIWSPYEETAVSVPSDDRIGYTPAAQLTQLKLLMDATRAAWPHTGLRLKANYMGNASQSKELLDNLLANKVSVGGPDILPNEETTIAHLFNGQSSGGITAFDYRGKIPWVAEDQGMAYCGKEGTYSPLSIFNAAMDGRSSPTATTASRPQYFVWTRQGGTGCNDRTKVWYDSSPPAPTGTLVMIGGLSPAGAVSDGVTLTSSNPTRLAPSVVRATCPTAYPGCN